MTRTSHSGTRKSARNGALSAALLASLIMAAAPAFAVDKTYSSAETISGGHGFDGTVTIQNGVGLTGSAGTTPHITAGVGFILEGGSSFVENVTFGDYDTGSHATLRKIGTGQSTLVGDFDHSGLTTVEEGQLVLGNTSFGGEAGNLNSTSGIQVWDDTTLVIDNGTAGFDFSGRIIEVDGPNGLFGVLNETGSSAITNTIVTGNGIFGIAGGGEVIVGGGVVGFDETNINVSRTMVSEGTLRVAADGSLTSTVIEVGGTLGTATTLHIDAAGVVSPGTGGVATGDVELRNDGSAVKLTNGGNLYGDIDSITGVDHLVEVLSGGYISGDITLADGDVVISGTNPDTSVFDPASAITGDISIGTGSLSVAAGGIVYQGRINIGTGSVNVDNASLGLSAGSFENVKSIRITEGDLNARNGASIFVKKAIVLDAGDVNVDNSTINAKRVKVKSGDINVLNGSSIRATRIAISNGWLTVDESSEIGKIGGDVVIRTGGVANINGIVLGSLSTRGGSDTGGVLMGNATINGKLINRGTLAPGKLGVSAGTVTVGGNFRQGAKGTYIADILSSKSHDQVLVGGRATINGGVLLINNTKSKARRGDKITVLTSNELRVNEAYKLKTVVDSMLSTHVHYTETDVQVHLEQEKFSPLGRNANERSVARAVDYAAQHGQLDSLFDHLNYTDKSNVPDLLARLSPEALATIFTVGFANTQINTVNIERRLDDVRDGVQGFSARGLSLSDARGSVSYDGMPISSDRDGLTLAGYDGKSIIGKNVVNKEVAPVTELSRWGFFMTGSGEWADVKSTFGSQGGDFTSGGVTVGADYRVSENFVVGLNGAYVNTDVDIDNGGGIRANGGRGGVYASYFQGGAYVNAAANGGYNSYKITRSTLGGDARGKTEGGQFDALLGGGYDFSFGNFSVGPLASLQYAYVGFNGFSENGSDADLTVRSNSQNSLRSAVGLKASGAFEIGSMVLRPEVRAQWKHEFLDTAGAIDSSFTGSGALFTVHGPKIGRDSLVLDAGATLDVNETVSVFAYYTGELGRTNYQSNSVNGGFSLRF